MQDEANWLAHDHRKYEAALAECELAAGAGEWKEAVQRFREFVEDFKLHMRMEDEVVYPLFAAQGDPDGAIASLSDEHDTIVRLLRDLSYVIKRSDADHVLDSLPPLRRAMAEHNAHEETVFLGAGSDSVLLRRTEILARLDALQRQEGRQAWDL